MWHTIRTINTARFSVALQYQPDDDASADDFCPDTAKLIEQGCCAAYLFRVVVRWCGVELGAEYLGASVYDNPELFGREHYGHNHTRGRAYFPDMLRTAIAETRTMLNNAPPVHA